MTLSGFPLALTVPVTEEKQRELGLIFKFFSNPRAQASVTTYWECKAAAWTCVVPLYINSRTQPAELGMWWWWRSPLPGRCFHSLFCVSCFSRWDGLADPLKNTSQISRGHHQQWCGRAKCWPNLQVQRYFYVKYIKITLIILYALKSVERWRTLCSNASLSELFLKNYKNQKFHAFLPSLLFSNVHFH